MSLVSPCRMLLPRGEDKSLWSVVACDQFTSQSEYWEKAERLTGGTPSALRLMLPEAWLNTGRALGAEERIASTMEEYLRSGVWDETESAFLYLERTQSDGRIRRGLMAALDLEQYDFAPGSRTPVRATEGTVEERLPPRVSIRSRAAVEMPHVMVLMDDRDDRVLHTAAEEKDGCRPVYDFELMLGGGHLRGWLLRDRAAQRVQTELDALDDPALQREKYGAYAEKGSLTLAVGDGNHSLAAARRWWEQLRPTLPPSERENHPARYALVELCNIHDPALDFEPIHRVLFDTDTAPFAEAVKRSGAGWEDTRRTLGERVAAAESFCREYIALHGGRIDYIHGDETARKLGERKGCAAVILPPISKEGLFLSVLRNGALPRKSFSMGHAEDKRYYLECRRIR